MRMRVFRRSNAGITLPEILISSAVAALVIGALFAGSVALQHQFNAATLYVESQADQIRVLDFIEMDLRRATAVTFASGSTPLTVTMPNYYQTVNGLKVPRNPAKSGVAVDYGAGSLTVAYSLQGTNLIRTEAGVAKTIATTVQAFPQPARAGSTVTTTLSFVSPMKLSGTKPTISLISKVLLRNIQ